MLERHSMKAAVLMAFVAVLLSGGSAQAQVVTEFSGGITAGSPADTPLAIAIEPARPTATDDIVVISTLTSPGCRLLDSPFLETRETRADADVTVGDAEWLIPAVARSDGLNGAHWTTDLAIFSTSAVADTAVTLTFLANGGAEGSVPRATISVPPLGAVRLEDVLGTTFDLQQGSGALLVTSPSLGLRFAPSIGTPSGGGRIAQPVPARGMTQLNRVVRALRVEEKVAGVRLTVTAVDAADGIAVLASVIDNATNAPLTLTPQ